MNAPPSRAAIAAAPFPLAFDRATTALIVIDMQRDFLEPGGFGASLGNDVSRLAAIVPTTRRLIEGCRAAGLPVIHTKECHRPDLSDLPPAKRDRGAPMLRIGDPGPMGRVLIAGEPGTDIVADLAALPGETVIEKPGKGAFYRTDLAGILARGNIRTLVVAGVTTEVCVQTTMREANDRGFECLLVEDATESYFPEFKAATLAMIRAQGGIVGWTAPADAVLAALATRGAGAEPRFAPGAIAAAPPPAATSAFASAASAFHGSGATVVPDLAATFDALPFEPFRPGVEICHLVRGDDTHAGTALLRYQPGTATPRHQHGGLETILVLRGSQQDENGVYPAGTFVANPAGSIHKVSSADGCMVLIQWERPVRMLED